MKVLSSILRDVANIKFLKLKTTAFDRYLNIENDYKRSKNRRRKKKKK